jgi:hypothetical protein
MGANKPGDGGFAVRYRFTSEKSSKRSKVAAGLPWPLLAMIAGVPAALSLGVIVLTAPQPDAPRVTREAAATAAAPPTALPMAAFSETAPPAPTSPPSQSAPKVADVPVDSALSKSQNTFDEPRLKPLEQNEPCVSRVVQEGVWCVEYYADRDQNDSPYRVELRDPPGSPVMIDWPTADWPMPDGMPQANYRVVLSGTFYFPDTRSYLFTLRLRGSARIHIDGDDGSPDIDTYFVGRKQPGAFRLPVSRGYHSLRFDFYLDEGPSSIHLAWQPDGNRSNFWLGRYYNNTTMTPPVAMIRQDDGLNFVWDGSPGGDVQADNFSVQWLRILNVPRNGTTCHIIADDRVRVFVDGRQIPELSNWDGASLEGRTVTLNAGRRMVEVHFTEMAGRAQIQFNCNPVVPAY